MIRVTKKNADKITQAIDKAQSAARVRTICRADVFDAVEEIEKKLSKLLYKKDWLGLEILVDTHAQSFPGAYRGTPESTFFVLIRRPSGWFMDRIRRSICSPGVYAVYFQDKSRELAEFATDKFR